jgi:hypothetical protein
MSVTRRKFQIHLSTTIVLTFLAGVLVWANATPQTTPYSAPGHFSEKEQPFALDYGWPFVFRRDLGLSDGEPIILRTYHENGQETSIASYFNAKRLALDLALALAMLCAGCIAFDWFIRRREARKP